jgi:hypothetical protein
MVNRVSTAPLALSVCLLAASCAPSLASNAPPTGAPATATPSPWTTQSLPACSPQPCAGYNGMILHILSVNKNYRTWVNGFHMVRISVTHQDVSGEQLADPTNEFALRDAVGVWQQTGSWLIGEGPVGCLDPAEGSIRPTTMAPGASIGPFSICFQAGGASSAPLVLSWQPSSLTHNGELGPNCSQQDVPASYVPSIRAVLFVSNMHGCSAILQTLP